MDSISGPSCPQFGSGQRKASEGDPRVEGEVTPPRVSLCVKIPSSYEDTSQIRLWPTLTALL